MSELREVVAEVGGESVRGYFHGWRHYSQIVEPSIMRGGHGGGQISETYAIVEAEDGKVFCCLPGKLRFIVKKDYPGGGCDVCKKYAVRRVHLIGNSDGLGVIKVMFCPSCGRDLRGNNNEG